MYVQLDHEQKALLTELVESRIGEIGSEIRRCRDSTYHDKLKEQKVVLVASLQRLHEAEYDVTS